MALVFEHIVTKGLGDISYLIGDDSKGFAAVIDPRAGCRLFAAGTQAQGSDHPYFSDHIHFSASTNRA